MADYAAQAASIYDPQLAAEQAGLRADQATTDAGFAGESNTAQSAYTQALTANTKGQAAQEDRNNFTANTHGLWQSGLIANMQRMTGADYGAKAADIETARANKLSDIAARRQATNQGYTDKLGALASKYQGAKSQYIADHQNEDIKFAQQQAAENARAARSDARAAAKAPTAAELRASAYSNLQDDVAGGLKGYGKGGGGVLAKGYTEKLVSQLQNAYAAYGLSNKDIANYVYNYRKATYGN